METGVGVGVNVEVESEVAMSSSMFLVLRWSTNWVSLDEVAVDVPEEVKRLLVELAEESREVEGVVFA